MVQGESNAAEHSCRPAGGGGGAHAAGAGSAHSARSVQRLRVYSIYEASHGWRGGPISGSRMRYTKLGGNGPEVSIVCLVRLSG